MARTAKPGVGVRSVGKLWPNAFYLRLTAEEFIFRLLRVSKQRVLNHAEHGSYLSVLRFSLFISQLPPWFCAQPRESHLQRSCPDVPKRRFRGQGCAQGHGTRSFVFGSL